MTLTTHTPTATTAQLLRAAPLARPWATPQTGAMPKESVAKLVVKATSKLSAVDLMVAARSGTIVSWVEGGNYVIGQVEKLAMTPTQEIIQGLLGKSPYGVRPLRLTNDGAHWGELQPMPARSMRRVEEVAIKLAANPTALVWDANFRPQAHGWRDAGWNTSGGEHLTVQAAVDFLKLCRKHSFLSGVRVTTPRLGSAMDLPFQIRKGEFNKAGEELLVNGQHRPDLLTEGFTLRIS